MKILWQDKTALVRLLLLLAAWFVLFWPSLVAMEAVWRGSDTYTHAYAVPLIILWLLSTSQQPLSGQSKGRLAAEFTVIAVAAAVVSWLCRRSCGAEPN